MPLYREFKTQEELDWEYLPEIRGGDPKAFDAVIASRAARSAQAKLELHRRKADIPYGPTLIERLDIYPASQAHAPIVVFIHGGYWFDARVTKERYLWLARSFNELGLTAVIFDYEVCPKVTVDEIVRSSRAVIAWVYRNAESFDGDKSRIYVTGSSAGGHLTGMMAVTDWQGDYGLPADVMKGGCPISGLFDLEPFPYTWLQPKIQFTGQQIRRNSPILHVPENGVPLLVTWGAEESAEFWRQSQDFAAAWEKRGNRVETYPQEGKGHSSILDGLADPKGEFGSRLIQHIESCWKE